MIDIESRFDEFREILPIRVPIIQAPMAGGPSTPELVAAVSNAGGLGSLGAGYLTADELKVQIARVCELTSGAFSVNLMVPPTDLGRTRIGDAARTELESIASEIGLEGSLNFDPAVDNTKFADQLQVAIEQQVALVSFVFGLPEAAQVQALRDAGILSAGTATSIAEARAIEERGIDLVIFQGHEAGGHRGSFLWSGSVGLLALLELARTELKVPYVAAGGIRSGHGVAAVLRAGASAAQLGTAFLVAHESGASDEWKDRVSSATDTASVLTSSFSGKLARGLLNPYIARVDPLSEELPSYPLTNSITSKLRAQAKRVANPDFQSLWSGQGAPIDAVGTPASAIIDRLVRELRAASDF